MSKRAEGNDESIDQSQEVAALETVRSAAESAGKAEPEPKKTGEEHISVFWRVFGGTILSIVALVAITLFNNMSASITDLRNELSREREARAELVKKDEFNSRNTAMYERIRGVDAVKAEMEGLKEKVRTNTDSTAAAKKDAGDAVAAAQKELTALNDLMKKDAAALELLKERVVGLEAVKKDVAGLDSLKEKVATVYADLKALRTELSKVSGDIERNKTSDLERKAFRDLQARQVDDALKELQKGLQDCREKLARLEGAKPVEKKE
jgi:DNA repair exonuclease SbcCD ATPase subunit